MSDILRRIIEAQHTDENPFFKDAEGRIIEITAYQGEVFTGYYQADNEIYYSERDWLEQQRQLELDRIAEEEYQAEQKLLAAQRAERERKQKALEAKQQKETAQNDAKETSEIKRPAKNRKWIVGSALLIGVIVVIVLFWPQNTPISQSNDPDVLVTDTIQDAKPVAEFGDAIITGNDVRMRAEPDLKGKIVTFFPKEGERVELLTPSNDTLNWAQVRRENGTTGWVFGDYVKVKR